MRNLRKILKSIVFECAYLLATILVALDFFWLLHGLGASEVNQEVLPALIAALIGSFGGWLGHKQQVMQNQGTAVAPQPASIPVLLNLPVSLCGISFFALFVFQPGEYVQGVDWAMLWLLVFTAPFLAVQLYRGIRFHRARAASARQDFGGAT